MTPVFLATWKFGVEACTVGHAILSAGGSALDAVEKGANAVEENPAVESVGYGGLPNADGVVELDAAILDGVGHRAGAVGALQGIRKPISVARRVMERTRHVFLVGENARRFALREGFPAAELLTDSSRARWEAWRKQQTAPDVAHHDTVGVLALDARGNLAAGCTTSGLAWKVPGRVGDSPILGSGLYADNAVGAAAATGDGDEIMKACVSFRVVSNLERGMAPGEACREAIAYLLRKRGGHLGKGAAVIALDRTGAYGAAATRSGFAPPDRLWQWAVTDAAGNVTLNEGPYVEAG